MPALEQMQLWHWSLRRELLVLSFVSTAPLWALSPGRVHPVNPSVFGQDIVTGNCCALISAIFLVLPFTPTHSVSDQGLLGVPQHNRRVQMQIPDPAQVLHILPGQGVQDLSSCTGLPAPVRVV